MKSAKIGWASNFTLQRTNDSRRSSLAAKRARSDGMTNGRDMQGADIRAVVLQVVDEELPRQRRHPDGG